MSLHDAGALDPAGRPDLDRLMSVARLLAARAPGWPGMTRPAYRRWDLMAVTDNFEAWIIAWPPGGAIELHDHGGSSGAVVVAAGALRETRVVSQPPGTWALETSTIGVGETTSFADHDVHDIVNVADAPAISVHVYAPRLTTMTYYRMTQGVLEAGSTIQYRFGEAVA
jgi:Cysteine dioxygenase type I